MRTRRWLVGGAIVALTLLLLGSWFPLQRSPAATGRAPEEAQMQVSDSDMLRELAERLLGEGSGGGFMIIAVSGSSSPIPAPRARLLVGQLPERLPAELPIPTEARLLGSAFVDDGERFAAVARPGSFSPASEVQVVLDVPATTDVYAFYDQAMDARGWVLPPSAAALGFGGFQDIERAELSARVANAPLHQGQYCLRPIREQPHGASLEVKVYTGRDGMLDVRLVLGTGARSLCFIPSPDPTLLLPQLILPDGIEPLQTMVVPHDRTTPIASDAHIASSMSVAELAEHFGTQLREAGWTRIEDGGDALMAWSRWQESAPGGRKGFLTVVAVPGEDLRSLSFVIPGQTGTR